MREQESGRAAGTATTANGEKPKEIPVPIVPEKPGEVKNDLRQLRLMCGAPVKDMVEVVRALYPKYDKVIQSKVEHGDEYGIQLRPDAMRALLYHFSTERPSAPKADGRTKPYRIQASTASCNSL